MPASVAQYIIECSFCLLLFFFLYQFLLRKETFFQVNRVYLLITPLLSFLIPYLHIQIDFTPAPIYKSPSEAPLDLIFPTVNDIQAFQETMWEPVYEPAFTGWAITLGEVALGIYLLGMIVTAARQLYLFWRMYHWISNQSNRRTLDGATLVEVPANFPAASFLNYIFLNREKTAAFESVILAHEMVHVKQRHSLDILLHEVLIIVFWFHPLIYLFRAYLKEVHEFIADHQVTQNVNPVDYAMLLVTHSKGSQTPLFTNTFNSITRKRLHMLGQSPSNRRQSWKYILALPLLSGLILLFSFDMVDELPEEITRPVNKLEHLITEAVEQPVAYTTVPTETYQLKWDERTCDCFEDQVTNYFHCENLSFRSSELKKLARQQTGFQLFKDGQPVFIKNIQVMSQQAIPMQGFLSQFEEQGAFNPESAFWKKSPKGNVLKVSFQSGEKTWFKFHLTVNDRRESLDYAYTAKIGDTRIAIDQMTKEGIRYLNTKDFRELLAHPMQILKNNTEPVGLASVSLKVPGLSQDLQMDGKRIVELKDLIPLQTLQSGSATLILTMQDEESLKLRFVLKDGIELNTATSIIPPKITLKWGRHTAGKWMNNLAFELPSEEIRNLVGTPFKLVVDGKEYAFKKQGKILDMGDLTTAFGWNGEVPLLTGAEWEKEFRSKVGQIRPGEQFFIKEFESEAGLKAKLVITAKISFDPTQVTKDGSNPFQEITEGWTTSNLTELDMQKVSRLQLRPGMQPLLFVNDENIALTTLRPGVTLPYTQLDVFELLEKVDIKKLTIGAPTADYQAPFKSYPSLEAALNGYIQVELEDTADFNTELENIKSGAATQDKIRPSSDSIIIREGYYLEIESGRAKVSSTFQDSAVLFVLDGVLLFKRDVPKYFNSIDPNDVKSITVIKGEKAIEQYGEAGKNGVIVIKTKFRVANKKKPKTQKTDGVKSEVKTQKKRKNRDYDNRQPISTEQLDPSNTQQVLTSEIFPNAAVDQVTVRFKISAPAEKASITMFDIQGKEVHRLYLGSLDAGTHNRQINLNTLNLPGGKYIVHLQVDNLANSKQLIIAQ